MCPQSVKVLPYSQFVDTSFWVKGPVSTKCECDVLQTLCGHTFPRQGSCVHKVSYDALQIRCGHIFPPQGSCVHKVSCDALQRLCGHIFLSQGSCVHKVWMWCPTDTLWTHLPESRVLCPQSVNVMSNRHFVDTPCRSNGPVSTKCQCDALHTPLWTHLPEARVMCPVSMRCSTDILRTHLPTPRVTCPQIVNMIPYRHFVDISSREKGPVFTKCQMDGL
jgi:hypothetical protein